MVKWKNNLLTQFRWQILLKRPRMTACVATKLLFLQGSIHAMNIVRAWIKLPTKKTRLGRKYEHFN